MVEAAFRGSKIVAEWSTPESMTVRELRVLWIKPARYGDDGALLQYRWGVIPAHTPSILDGLARAWAESRRSVKLQTSVWDELFDRALDAETIASILAAAERDRVQLLIALTGVQTGEYPRARDLALQFRARGARVAIGGFHVSSDPPSRAFLESVGVTTVVGEAETILADLLDDFVAGELRPNYRVDQGLRVRTGVGNITVPQLAEVALPVIEPRYLRRFFNPYFATIDTSRGCPFVCSFCAVKNVMGRTVRARDPKSVVDWIRRAYDEHGVNSLLFVDDDLYRSPVWEPLFRGLSALRREGREISFFMQSDVAAAATANRRGRRFVEMAAEAGCYQAFMGFESFEPDNLTAIAKVQNRAPGTKDSIDERDASRRLQDRYRDVVATWHAAGIGVHCGYMFGLPGDRPGCGKRAARRLADIGVDIVSFFAATPLPGTEDYAAACADGSLLTDDWARYDTTHFVRRHAVMSRRQLEREYAEAYRQFYSYARMAWSAATVHAVPGLSWPARLGMAAQQAYYGYAARRGWHPMLGGVGRRRTREVRRAVSDEEARRIYLRGEQAPDFSCTPHCGRAPA